MRFEKNFKSYLRINDYGVEYKLDLTSSKNISCYNI